jgi:hypothetical protein
MDEHFPILQMLNLLEEKKYKEGNISTIIDGIRF